ncbi:MAG: enoyl-CoA hydratase/isomerase family protein [Tatlockia sp.]|jgi:enoyl-CoA hydratase/carnithine racemase
MHSDIEFSVSSHIGLISLNRPQALNALTLDMINALYAQLGEWEACPAIQAVVITSANSKAFCAGGDVRWLYEAGLAKNRLQTEFFKQEYQLNYLIHRYSKPYIALLDGITMGGGVGISLHGSHPVATERFVFAMPETSIGFFPDIGASYLLARCPDALGIYLGLTGNRLNAQEAKALGLVNEMISSDSKGALLQELVTGKKSIDQCLKKYAVRESIEIPHKALLERCFSHSSIEAIFTALEAEDSPFAQSLKQDLEKKSPLSLKITLMAIQKAKQSSMAECVKTDYCLVKHFMKDRDFYEGVRALLIDKDKAPKWQPDSLAAVTTSQLAEYFENEGDALVL